MSNAFPTVLTKCVVRMVAVAIVEAVLRAGVATEMGIAKSFPIAS